ncbi:MAG TPA: peptidoglycan-associated lipoprotein Pal [Casimicrobiaceae bacterium]|nr:peptidoglycan-associated lipoprotein Pal [Casimicrobiaceae bacterium]
MSKQHLATSRFGLWTGIALAALLAACQQNPPAEKAATVEERSVTPGGGTGATTSGTTGANVAGTNTGQGNPLHDPRSILSKRSVFFDFDSYAVKDDYRPLIDAHGKYLQANRSARMTIQGNCDERGSREYNIALGQRRADAVKRMMLLDGATDAQIETVSFGKEKPRNAGHDEGAWAENRRDDFVYAGE